MRRCAFASRLLVCSVLALVLAGCSWVPFVGGKKNRPDGPQLADVVAELPALELPTAVAAQPTRDEVMAAYERVYGLIPDTVENHAVGKRLADLNMSIGEERDIAGADDPYSVVRGNRIPRPGGRGRLKSR